MADLYLRFYEELNDFLPSSKYKREYKITCNFKRSVKDLIESEGVPHAEVDLILVNGAAVDFDHIVEDGDKISIYPVFESFDISDVTKLEDRPLRRPTFILDVHLGKLAKYLRLFGFDTVYSNDYDDEEIALWAAVENRIILTRDIGLLKRSQVDKGYWLRHQKSQKQLEEVFNRFQLYNLCRPFSLCMICNGKITAVSKEEIADELLPETKDTFDEFFKCHHCQKIYWKGSHYEKMIEFVESIKSRTSF